MTKEHDDHANMHHANMVIMLNMLSLEKTPRFGKIVVFMANNQRSPIKFRPSLFWDVDPKTIDPRRNAPYIIERVLDFGNDDEVRWLWQNYSKREIYDVIKKRRGISKQTRALWILLTAPGK